MSLEQDLRTIDPDRENEYVGVYSEPLVDYCCYWMGDYIYEGERCDADATHTVVMRGPDGELHEISMCDECGCPGDA